MGKVKHKAGFIDTDGIRALTWNTPTAATIWWQGGLIGTFEFDDFAAQVIRMEIDIDAKRLEESIEKLKAKGHYWREIERTEALENLEDYKDQRRKLREQGIYASQIEAGTFHYQITSDDGNRKSSGSFHFGPGEDVTPPL